jgi:tyrosine aminotransferase
LQIVFRQVITLQPGDCTLFKNFPPQKECVEALKKALNQDIFSYYESAGEMKAREAVAEYSRQRGELTSEDVILTSGCSMALESCFKVIANPGENVLIPRPAWNYS